MKFSKEYIENLKQKLKPNDFYKSLAQDGFLDEYIDQFLFDKYVNDPVFRENIQEYQFEYSNEPVPYINYEILNQLNQQLKIFIENNNVKKFKNIKR